MKSPIFRTSDEDAILWTRNEGGHESLQEDEIQVEERDGRRHDLAMAGGGWPDCRDVNTKCIPEHLI